MTSIQDMLVAPFRRLLADVATPEAVRVAEQSPGVPPLWEDIQASGFLDALVPESSGGAGLSLADIFPLVAMTGEFSLPVPFGETVVARALLASRGVDPPPDATIVLAPFSPIIPLAASASHALIHAGNEIHLIKVGQASSDPFRAGGGGIDRHGEPVLSVERKAVDLMEWAAALTAARMAGAMRRLLEMSLLYVNERHQFGRALSKFQAIQHQLAVMTEQTTSAWVAARIGFAGPHFDGLRVALAKCRVGEASHQVCAIAHAVHGAMGVTEEYDLQLLTRRVKQGQIAFGSEQFWAERLGRARLASDAATAADFVRLHLQDVEEVR